MTTMRCNKVTFNERTKAEYDEVYSGEPLELADIKTIYAAEKTIMAGASGRFGG